MNFQRISSQEAFELLDSEQGSDVQIVDVRDEESFQQGHINRAVHLHNSNIQEFVAAANLDAPLLVYCYHGHLSQAAAAYLAEQGFSQAYSLDGGFAAWPKDGDG